MEAGNSSSSLPPAQSSVLMPACLFVSCLCSSFCLSGLNHHYGQSFHSLMAPYCLSHQVRITLPNFQTLLSSFSFPRITFIPSNWPCFVRFSPSCLPYSVSASPVPIGHSTKRVEWLIAIGQTLLTLPISLFTISLRKVILCPVSRSRTESMRSCYLPSSPCEQQS